MFTFKTKEKRMIKNILNELDPDDKIYRVVSVNRFFELLGTQNLTLVKPHKWDDPFDNLLANTIATNQKDEQVDFNRANTFYGQCWTLRKECDGIWRSYASLDYGVRMETTVRKLLEVLFKLKTKKHSVSCFIGKVRYLNESKIISFLQDDNFVNWATGTTGENTANTLLIKRDEFKYEKEVRLLYSGQDNHNKNETFQIDINPIDLFESVCFAPQMPSHIYNIYRKNLINRGFDSDMISISKLYDPYKITIRTNNS